MPNSPVSISDWRELSAKDPELSVQAFNRKLESIPPKVRKRVFASLPSLMELSDGFSDAVSAKPDASFLGVPYLLKDLYDFPGFQTTASSDFLPEIRPLPQTESSLSQDLRAKGAVFAGKTHLNEFAYGLSGENKHFGDCPHPVFPERLSGGSSSGSAWAVAKGIVPIATGTDTGGSIRVPAAWCGIYGIRFSPNRWSTDGCFPLASSFDTAGWFCKTASDMETSFKALLKLKRSPKQTLQGVSLLSVVPEVDNAYRAKFMDTAEKLNANEYTDITNLYLKATRSVAKHYSVLQSIDAYKTHKEWLDDYKDRYDPVVWQRIDRARRWSSEEIDSARKAESAILEFFEVNFKQYDFIAIPATQSPAITAAGHSDSFRSRLLELTAPGSFARCPVLTIPIQVGQEAQGVQILYKSEDSEIPLRLLQQLGTSELD